LCDSDNTQESVYTKLWFQKPALIQTLQMETGVYKKKSESDTINRDRCLQKQLWFKLFL
jgi:hypothetical protein